MALPTLLVPLSPEAKTMSSEPAPLWLASRIAWRRLPPPESLRLVTVSVAACALPVVASAAPIAIVAPAATFRVLGPPSAPCLRLCCLRRRCLWLIETPSPWLSPSGPYSARSTPVKTTALGELLDFLVLALAALQLVLARAADQGVLAGL